MQILTTSRTRVEMIGLAHASFFLELVNTPEWLRFIGDRKVQNIADAESFLQTGLLKSYSENTFGYYLVSLHSGTPIGICGFLQKPFLSHPDLGFAFLSQFQGQGYGNESAAAILEYGIREFGFEQLDAVTQADNLASINLLQKLSFRHTGHVTPPDTDRPLMLFQRQFA